MTWHPPFQPKLIKRSQFTALWWCFSTQPRATGFKHPSALQGFCEFETLSLTYCWNWKESAWRAVKPELLPELQNIHPWKIHLYLKKKKKRNSIIRAFTLFSACSSLEFKWNSVRDPYGLLWLKFNFLSVCKLIAHGANGSYLGFGGRHCIQQWNWEAEKLWKRDRTCSKGQKKCSLLKKIN